MSETGTGAVAEKSGAENEGGAGSALVPVVTANALVVPSVKGVVLTETGATLPAEMTLKQFGQYATNMILFERASQWFIGDIFLQGEKMFSVEDVERVTAEARKRLAVQTLMNIKVTCNKFPQERRRANIPFSLHSELQKFAPETQEAWLNYIERENADRATLRAAIKFCKDWELEPNPDGTLPNKPGTRPGVPTGGAAPQGSPSAGAGTAPTGTAPQGSPAPSAGVAPAPAAPREPGPQTLIITAAAARVLAAIHAKHQPAVGETEPTLHDTIVMVLERQAAQMGIDVENIPADLTLPTAQKQKKELNKPAESAFDKAARNGTAGTADGKKKAGPGRPKKNTAESKEEQAKRLREENAGKMVDGLLGGDAQNAPESALTGTETGADTENGAEPVDGDFAPENGDDAPEAVPQFGDVESDSNGEIPQVQNQF